MIAGKGGMVAYLGTNSFKEACDRADAGDEQAMLISVKAAAIRQRRR